MNLQIFKPNSKNTGCAGSFQISQKAGQEPQFYLNCIAQHSWNAEKRTGSFSESRKDPSKMVAVKFNEFELGEFINTFQKEVEYSTFHTNDSTKTQIRLSTYKKSRGFKDNAVQITAFGLAITRNGSDVFKLPIEPGEGVRLTSFINRFFSVLDDYRAEQAKQNQKPMAQQSKPFVKAKPQVEAEPEVSEEDDDGYEF